MIIKCFSLLYEHLKDQIWAILKDDYYSVSLINFQISLEGEKKSKLWFPKVVVLYTLLSWNDV